MGQAIGGSLPLAIGIAISPIPIIAVVLMLTTPRAKINGPAFLLGWLLGLGIVGTIVLTIAGPSCTYPAPFLKKVTNRTSSLPGGTNGLCRPAPRWYSVRPLGSSAADAAALGPLGPPVP